ncbi:hypothetical protein GCM10022255_107370 [Dactylosporangium darangshiense]|uniref:Transposase n=1 Tax=Dactylosporangium darangshiense TaxID=579108 RepID=A0ABP8DTW7_9ACTN
MPRVSSAGGLPLATAVSAANSPDVAMLLPLLDGMSAVGRSTAAPTSCTRTRPTSQVAVRGGASSWRSPREGRVPACLGRRRRAIERTHSCLMRYRRLLRCYNQYANHIAAFVTIVCILICHREPP